MSLHDRLTRLEGSDHVEDTRPAAVPPEWRPGITWDGTKGTLSTGAMDTPPDPAVWAELIADWGLDPNLTEVVPGTVQVRGWDANVGGGDIRRLKYYRATLRPKTVVVTDTAGLEDLYKAVRKDKPRKATDDGDTTMVVALADWQVGNRDGGGAKAQIEAIAALPDLLSDRAKRLRKDGPLGHVVIAGMGDLGENTCGFYSNQTWLTELDRREQTRVVRRGITDIVRSLAPHAPRLTVTAVGGNHGENRQGGKAVTGPGDNDDVAVFEQVAEILAENPDTYGHIAFRLPTDRLAVSVNCSGRIVAFTHGHITKPRANAAETFWHWWKDQTHGRYYPGVADAEILVGGHFHHLEVRQQLGRTVMVCPSLTPVGDWWGNATGQVTAPGTLTFTVHTHHGWQHLEVIR